ncbi:MAG: replication initiator protein [Microviridae sp.]|nr:MAG: replication initiator protein [Microviridae sp.]
MHCIRPIKVSQTFDGTLTYKQKSAIPGLVGWQLPCRKCLPCRLKIGREKAIRAYHESKMHEDNIFLTLTYNDDHCPPRLLYEHWQTFIKDLRDRVGYSPDVRISTMVTGEYGDKSKRPHWHALIFNFRPHDQPVKPFRETDFGPVYRSPFLQELWGMGNTEYGSVTMDSASYVGRYAAKKLSHGNDQDHDYHPIHKTSSKNALGKSWIEKYWKQTLNHGYVTLPNGAKASIPRYYLDWAKKNRPSAYETYVTQTLPQIMHDAELRARKEEIDFFTYSMNPQGTVWPLDRSLVKHTVLKQKFKKLQEHLKL